MQTGRRTVTASASKLFSTSTAERCDIGIQIYAGSGNSAPIYLSSNPLITANSNDDTDGYPIAANEKLLITERNPNDIYVVSPTGNQTLWFIIQ
jgi:type 1 fimbria pilin